MLPPETGFRLLSWECAVVAAAFLAWVGNFFVKNSSRESSVHPYSNAAIAAIVGMCIGIAAVLELFRLFREDCYVYAISLTVVGVFILLSILYRIPSLWDREGGGAVGFIIGAGVPCIMLIKLFF